MVDFGNVNLDANVNANSGDYTLIPPGTYKVMLVADALEEASTGAGKVYKMRWQIIEGQYTGEQIEDNLNILRYGNTEKDATCQRIGQGRLRYICELVGVPWPIRDTSALIGKKLGIKVKHEEYKNQYGDTRQSAKIAKYLPLDEVSQAPSQETQPQPAASQKQEEEVPW
jgi:hypothetical protein